VPRGGIRVDAAPRGLGGAGPGVGSGGSDQAGDRESRFGGGSVSAAPGPLDPPLRAGQLVDQVQSAVLLGVDQELATMSTGKIFLK
jgi:hypothetical protein